MRLLRSIINLCFFFLLFFIVGCKEDGWFPNTTIEGVVIDTTTNSPIVDVNVDLSYINYQFLAPSKSVSITSTKTDKDGTFKIKFRDNKKKYIIYCYKNGEYYPSQSIPVLKKDTEKKTIYLYPLAKLIIHLKNTNPYAQNDYIWVNGAHVIGINVDTSFTYYANGNVYNKICWNVKKNEKAKNYMDSIYCPSFITTYFNINY